ncbi:hypothetical protein AB6A40_001803 [Gnathostoma spinigerum]|uniref:Uncharacterized protein n=1 Tax=Gnathostoma spinigerum TaxID=75299 RepID=A0ABD6ECQ0_9BILA
MVVFLFYCAGGVHPWWVRECEAERFRTVGVCFYLGRLVFCCFVIFAENYVISGFIVLESAQCILDGTEELSSLGIRLLFALVAILLLLKLRSSLIAHSVREFGSEFFSVRLF